MRVISFNLNGIRSALNKGLAEWVAAQDADFVCFQEIKIDPDALEPLKALFPGYTFYSNHADKKGYSGVSVLAKRQPKAVSFAANEHFDSEGRIVRLDFEQFTLVNAYFPSGTMGDHRQEVKDSFLEYFSSYIAEVQKLQPHIIITGDFNVCHTEIDIHDPKRNATVSGFLPHERAWVTRFLEQGFADGLRIVSQEPKQYTWWSFRAGAKSKNLGWRIDYIMVDKGLVPQVQDFKIYPEVMMSDHCPIELFINL